MIYFWLDASAFVKGYVTEQNIFREKLSAEPSITGTKQDRVNS